MKIGIIVGSIREGRLGEQIGQWALDTAQQRVASDATEYVLLDLKSFDVPLYASEVLPAMANKSYEDARVQAWSDAIDACDAFVFITPEYNHSVPGAMKNAVDCLGSEWRGKPLGFIGYSATGGIRAVEHWRAIMANFECPMLRTQLSFSIFDDVTDGTFTPNEHQATSFNGMLTELERAAQ